MAVVSISRQFGAGGKTLGDRLARRLGYQMIHSHILYLVAKEAKVSLDWVRSVEREAGGRLMRILAGLVPSDFIERHLGEEKHDFDEKRYVEFLTKVIQDIADAGNAIILGRGSQYILAQHPDTVRVLLVATWDFRVKFLMDHYDLSRSKAEGLVQKEERKRARFLKNFSEDDPNDPVLYHLTINTGLVGLDEAENLVVELVHHLEHTQSPPVFT